LSPEPGARNLSATLTREAPVYSKSNDLLWGLLWESGLQSPKSLIIKDNG
jgi:hypothetical protein